jgi:hypothetical protein
MKKVFQTTFLLLATAMVAEAAPVTVTINGGYLRTDRWTDPSTCRTFDRIVCGTLASACYTISYDDGTVTGGNGLPEGPQTPPVHVVLTSAQGTIINEGLVSFYQHYALPEQSGIHNAHEYTFEECETP